MGRKKYSVKEKEQHYKGIIANAEKVDKASEKAHKEVARVNYAKAYVKAVGDCRAALIEQKSAKSTVKPKAKAKSTVKPKAKRVTKKSYTPYGV